MKNIQEGSQSLSEPLIDDEKQSFEQVAQKSRRNRAGFISKLFFAWVYGTIDTASSVTLESNMIEDLKFEDTSEQLYYRFLNEFTKRKNEKNGLLWALLGVSKWQCIFVFSVMLLNIGASLSNPILIKLTIEYLMQTEKEVQEGIYLVVSIIAIRMVSVICQQHAFYNIRIVGYDWMGILSLALLGKSMNVSYQSNKDHTSGQVLNYMQVDAMKLQWVGWYMSQVMLMPLQIGVSIYMMFRFIGVAFLGGLGVIFLTAVFNVFVGKKMMQYQVAMMKDKDKRTTCANEIFQQIKFIKVNAYEEYFREKLTKLRDQEIKTLRTRFFISCLNILSIWLSPMLILNATFVIFVAIGNDLTPSNTFAIISLFQSLQGPLLFLPMALNALIEANISFRRVQGFLLTNELMDDCITNTSQTHLHREYLQQLTASESPVIDRDNEVMKTEIDSDVAIRIDQGTFYWSKYKEQQQQAAISQGKPQSGKTAPKEVQPLAQEDSEPILVEINLRIQKGQFVSIVGDVGSGKTSLIQAILGEMLYKDNKPRVQINGSIAYVSQKAWIQNATVKDNIIFGLEFNEQRYNDAIKYSCLKEDLKILIKGDQTMIGEKGVNLSGGQKARVTLARAIYSDSDIYLLDDPISAVDVHVGKQIIYECLNGYLQQKTRILITHALNYCQYTDYIYLMDNGKIIEQGTFQQIKLNEQFKKVYDKFYKNTQENQEQSQPDEEIAENTQKLELVKKQSSQQEAPKEPLQKDEVDELMLLEDRNKGNINASLLGQYVKLTGGVTFTIVMFLMLGLWGACYVGSALWMAYWTKSVSDDIANDKETNNYYYLIIYVILSISSGVLVFLRSWAFVIVSSNSANRMHNKMVSCLMYAPQCQFFERVPQGRIMNRLTKDQNVLDSELHWMINWTLIQVFMLIANSFLNIYTSSLWVLLPMVLYFILCWKIQRVYMTASRELFRMEAISKSPILSYFSESIMGITLIRAFQRQKQIMHKHGQNQDLNRKIFLEQIATNQWFGLVLGLSSFMVNTTAIVFCMFYSTQNPAYAGLLMTYASTLDQNINGTVQCLGNAENGLISFERCVAYTHVKPEKGYEKAVKNYQNGKQYKDQYIPNWPTNGVIEFRNFSVKYREGLPLALKNMSAQINPREKLGIVGRTGAGKSTITLTILRILEAINGQLLIDNQDVQTLSLRQLRESITMIMQDPTLFEGTLRDNIDPLKLRTDDEIKEAINKCCLSELIEQRNGLETIIKDHGDNLSAGEKQLVCIARAVLKKSPIVLIDEATANIDIDTEHKIQETIQNAFKECTVITIAHRINTILHCDKILVLDKGEVKEFGYTKDLLNQRDSLFYGIYQEALREQQK